MILSSILISTGSNFMSDLFLLRKKAQDNINVMLDVAADTTNSVLDNITRMINSVEKLDSYHQIKQIPRVGYELNHQISRLTNELNTMVMTNSDIEIVAVDYRLQTVHSGFLNSDYYTWIKRLRQNREYGNDQRYLLQIAEIGGQQRLAVIAPREDAVISVLVSQELENRLDFFERDLSIRQNDVEAVLGSEGSGEKLRLSKPLKLPGWEISCAYNVSFLKSYGCYFCFLGISFVLYLFIAYFVLRCVSSYVFDPIRSLSHQVVELDPVDLDSRIDIPKHTHSFSRSVLLSYMVLSFLPMLVITYVSYGATQSIIERDIGNIVEKNINILSRQTETAIKNRLETANEIVISHTTQRFLIEDQQALNIQEIFQIQEIKNVTVYNLALYDLDGICQYSSMYLKEYAQKQLPDRENMQRKQIHWQPDDPFGNRTIRISMPIINIMENSDTYGKRIGYMVLDFLENPVTGALDSIAGKYGGYGEITDRAAPEVPLHSVGDKKLDMIAISQKLDRTNWVMNFAIPHNQYYAQAAVFIWVALVIMMVLCLFILLLSYFLYRYFMVNVNAIQKVVGHTNMGDLNIRFYSEQKDEIYALGNGINQMLDRINRLILEKYVIELRSQEIELNLLQSQINPHFLCNTLRTIEYMASTNDPRTMEIIQKLIYLFRRCTEVRSRLVPLEEELKYISYYADIQKVRFGEKFTVSFDVPEELRECHVLQFILQPVVENAIYHGFKDTEASGEIKISVSLQEHVLRIAVSDNGEGMSEQDLEQLQKRLNGETPSKSVGLINVHDRLKLYYGAEFGLSISSVLGKGTTVTLALKE